MTLFDKFMATHIALVLILALYGFIEIEYFDFSIRFWLLGGLVLSAVLFMLYKIWS